VLPGTISDDTTLWPQAQRDTGVPIPGYNYASLDYLASNVTLSAVLTLTNGVAVGLCGSYGFTFPYIEPEQPEVLGNGGSQIVPLTDSSGGNGGFTSFGLPRPLNTLVRARNVQEEPLALGGSTLFSLNTSSPTLALRFTDVALAQGLMGTFLSAYFPDRSFGAVSLRDCLVSGAALSVYANYYVYISGSLTNNLLDRCSLNFTELGSQSAYFTLTMYNNLFRAGTLSLYYYAGSNPSWYVQNNLFDLCANSLTGDSGTNYITRSYNGFTTNTVNGLNPTKGSYYNKVNLVSGYQTGPLGSYYYPTNGGSYSLTNLINAGSTWATNAGLYHFTTTTNQVKEGSSKVDIGFHYVAVDANGSPIDSDGDGVPDYLEDLNGNGNATGDPTSWLIYNSPNGLTGSSGLRVFTPLK
jgi:hypothetical protein